MERGRGKEKEGNRIEVCVIALGGEG